MTVRLLLSRLLFGPGRLGSPLKHGHPIIFSQFRLSSRPLPLPYPVLGLLLEGSSTQHSPRQ